jgi:hypothetical protein
MWFESGEHWSRRELGEFHAARGALYQAVWRLLAAPLDPRLLDQLRADLRHGTARLAADSPFFALVRAAATLTPETLAELRTAVPAEACRGTPGAGWKESFAAVGLSPSPTPLAEMRVLSLLAVRLSAALARDDYEQATTLGDLQLALLQAHSTCVHELSRHLSKSGQPILAAAAHSLEWLIERDLHYLDSSQAGASR